MLNNKAFIGYLLPKSLVLKIIVMIILFGLIIPALMFAFPIFKYVAMALIAFFIYGIIVRSLGNNVLSYVLLGVILYFLLYKYAYLTAFSLTIYLFITYGVMSAITWGTSKFSGQH